MGEMLRKLGGWLRRDAIEDDLREEMQTHLEMKAEDAGDWRAARLAFGNPARLLEDARAEWGWPRLEAWARDLGLAFRRMRRRPGFSATVVLTLAVGIGASSTVFSLIDAVLIRPLRYPAADRMVAVQEQKLTEDRARTPVAPGRLEDWRGLTTSFESLAGVRIDSVTDTSGGEPERLSVAFVSPGFFDVLATPAALGRTFHEEEERFGGPAVAIISDGLWQRRFGADPFVVGRSLSLPGGSVSIVGVMPPTVDYPSAATEIWIPLRTPPELMARREARFLQVVGRLKPDVPVEQARAELQAAQHRLGALYPVTDAGWGASVRPLKEELTGPVVRVLWLLLGSVGLLLLIACANVTGLLLAQLTERGTEIAARRAIGAGRGAIARQLLAEGLVYALAGGVLGLGAAAAGVEILRGRLTALPRVTELAVDLRVLAFVLTISMLTAVLLSLVPVWHAWRPSVASADAAIRGGRGIAGGSQRLPRALVVAQLALATVLLVGAGLFVRSLIRLQDAPVGFHPERVLTLRVGASAGEAPASTIARHQRMLDALTALPGVSSVAMSSGLPGVRPTWPREFQIAGEPTTDGALQFAGWRIVTADYFQTLGIPILDGRTCRMAADPKQAFEALVNRRFVERYLKGRNPLERTIAGGPIGDSMPRIVGVVADVKEDGAGQDAAPAIYACGYLRYWPDSDILIRTAGDPASMTTTVRLAIRSLESRRAVYAERPLTEAMSRTLAQDRFRTVLLTMFSLMALLLAAIGLYGVMAYMVAERTKEIGVRVALGAHPRQILLEILSSGGRLTAAGTIAGLVLAAPVTRLASTLLHDVEAFDTPTYLAAVAVLVAVSLVACLIPGRRATAIDPVRALGS